MSSEACVVWRGVSSVEDPSWSRKWLHSLANATSSHCRLTTTTTTYATTSPGLPVQARVPYECALRESIRLSFRWSILLQNVNCNLLTRTTVSSWMLTAVPMYINDDQDRCNARKRQGARLSSVCLSGATATFTSSWRWGSVCPWTVTNITKPLLSMRERLRMCNERKIAKTDEATQGRGAGGWWIMHT